MFVRNDDVSYDTGIDEIKKFCEICDRYKFKIIQAITPLGECQKVHVYMNNEEIKDISDKNFFQNNEVVDYLKSRNDIIAVHGLWHTHQPYEEEIKEAKRLLTNAGLKPTYFVPPFNEGNYSKTICGLKLNVLSLENGERLEDFLKEGEPNKPITYLHSWRFNSWYNFNDLSECLKRLQNLPEWNPRKCVSGITSG